MNSPYRIPDPPREPEAALDVSPAVVVLTVLAVVAAILLSRATPSSPGGGGTVHIHFATHSGCVPGHRR